MNASTNSTVIRVRRLRTQFGENVIHDNLDLDVARGEVIGVVGASGAGKTVLLRTIIGLNKAAGGRIELLGHDIEHMNAGERHDIQHRRGVLFQDGALFSSLTVAENIAVPFEEHTELSPALIAELTRVKIEMVGLQADTAAKFPSELSGGMRKRAGLARALALDPEILFLDEPTAGLDPIGAADFDRLIRDLQQSLTLTVFLVTHDLDTLVTICDRIAVLVDKRIIVGTLESLLKLDHPWVQSYFRGPRGRAVIKR